MKLLPLLLASLMISFALAGCFGGDDEKDDDEGDAMQNGNGDGMTNNTTEEDGVPLAVAVSDVPPNAFRFLPNALSAPANETLNLTVTSSMGATGNKLPHNFVIDDVVDLGGIAPGETKSVTFTVAEPGTYTYYCSVGNHRDLGMEGTLTVE